MSLQTAYVSPPRGRRVKFRRLPARPATKDALAAAGRGTDIVSGATRARGPRCRCRTRSADHAPDIRARKGGEPIVALTAYHAHTAGIVDRYCDFILVGDSLGMVMHGLETTVPVTLDMMILQGRAVMRGSKRALVVVDMPFGSYEDSASRRSATPRAC